MEKVTVTEEDNEAKDLLFQLSYVYTSVFYYKSS